MAYKYIGISAPTFNELIEAIKQPEQLGIAAGTSLLRYVFGPGQSGTGHWHAMLEQYVREPRRDLFVEPEQEPREEEEVFPVEEG